MYERMLDKNTQPTTQDIEIYLGAEAFGLLTEFEARLGGLYQLSKEMKFPFGNNYGWGYKFSRGATHICYAFFEAGAFTVMLQLGGKCVPKVEALLPGLLPATRELWAGRYPCGNEGGGWIHCRVLSERELQDVVELIKTKVPARRK